MEGLKPAGGLRPLGKALNQTTPPFSPQLTATQVLFNPDSSAVLALTKGLPGSKPSWVVAYGIDKHGNISTTQSTLLSTLFRSFSALSSFLTATPSSPLMSSMVVLSLSSTRTSRSLLSHRLLLRARTLSAGLPTLRNLILGTSLMLAKTLSTRSTRLLTPLRVLLTLPPLTPPLMALVYTMLLSMTTSSTLSLFSQVLSLSTS